MSGDVTIPRETAALARWLDARLRADHHFVAWMGERRECSCGATVERGETLAVHGMAAALPLLADWLSTQPMASSPWSSHQAQRDHDVRLLRGAS